MIVLKEIKELTQYLKTDELVNVTVGNFDGVHLGHQDFLNSIKIESVDKQRKFLVITFVPHPAFIISGRSSFLINTYLERRQLLDKIGVDFLLELDFTRDFSTLSPEEFLNKKIFSLKNIKKIFLGYDFQFGANKTGNFELAKSIAEKHDVELILHTEYKVSKTKVSSSVVREKILDGNVLEVTALLGREYFLSGRVIKGEGRGRKIGFPTANLGYDKDILIPGKGVYVTRSTVGDMTYDSLTNIGINPTFNTGYDIHIETHLLGFSRDIYGEEIKISFIDKIRDEQKFSSVNELVERIGMDIQIAKRFFKYD